MKSIVLKPLSIEVQNSDFVRRCKIIRVNGDAQISQKELWFQFPKSIEPPEDIDCDSYLLAVLMDAMKERRDIIVKGSVSLKLLSNLIEYQYAWNKWLPESFNIIDIKIESTRDNEPLVAGAICAFSGGVDSTFSVWRHLQGKNSYRSKNIKLCSLVLGFDIPLSDTDAFNNATKRATETLDEVGIKFVPIHTNCREISSVKWEYTHATALVATLANFKRVAGTCLVGSTDPYELFLGCWHLWGSNPITDHLLSSDEFDVVHDGASHNRIEKVNEIAEWEIGVENLRVCWEGDKKDRNCGKCEKCLRTMFAFLACGKPIPNCFPVDNDGGRNLKGIMLKDDIYRAEWRQILDYANRNGIKATWLAEVDKVIKRKPMIEIIFPKGSYRRLFVKNIIRKLSRR